MACLPLFVNACSASLPSEPDLSQWRHGDISSEFDATFKAKADFINRTPGSLDLHINIVGRSQTRSFVETALKSVSSIYDQCDVSVNTTVDELPDEKSTDIDLQSLYDLTNNYAQRRPTVFIIDSTRESELAFSYLPSLNRDVAATAWISSRVSEQCFAWIIAHEIGHIILDSAQHHLEPRNVMNARCSSSNFSDSGLLPQWTEQQCEVVRGGY